MTCFLLFFTKHWLGWAVMCCCVYAKFSKWFAIWFWTFKSNMYTCTYHLLLDVCSNYMSILYHFWDIRCRIMGCTWNIRYSRSLKMTSCDRSYMISCQSVIVSIAVSCVCTFWIYLTLKIVVILSSWTLNPTIPYL